MKLSFLIILASGLYAGSVYAQSADQTPAAAQTPPAAAPMPAADPMTMKPKEVREQCREQADGQGLKGKAKKAAVEECFLKMRPDLEAREKCRMDPSMKGKDKDERKALMKECMTNSKT
jgi:hypothetical protein